MAEPPPTGDPLDAVRTAAAEVARRSRHVHLVADRVDDYAAELVTSGALDGPGAGPDPWAVAADRGTDDDVADDEAVAGLVLALATINFGSGWHPVVRKRDGMSGAVTMATGLRSWAEATGPLTPDRLCELDTDTAHHVFDQPHSGDVQELVALLTVALNDLGRLVDDRYDGRFLGLVAAADGSAAGLVGVLDELTFYRDVSTYGDLDVPLYKRSQLAAADLHRAFGGVGPGRFDDLDRLTAFADNLVPHVLRVDGVLAFDDELADRIGAGDLLAAGGEEEVEIRALGVHAVERIRAALAEQGHDVPSWRLDQALWRRGGGPRYKAIPRHRARSVHY